MVCFQPHLYTRTRDFWPQLAAAFEVADEAVVMDVCGDREDPIEGITGPWWPTPSPRNGPGHLRAGLGRGGPVVAEVARPVIW